MNSDSCTRLGRLLGLTGPRRSAIGVLLGTALLGMTRGHVEATVMRSGKQRRRRSGGRLRAEAKPEPVTIEVVATRGSDGTFSASGAVVDAGTVTTEPRFSAGGAPGFLIIHATEVFSGELGTFTIKRQVKVAPADTPGISTGTGTWVVIHGTGDYATLRGQGTITLVLDETVQPAEFTFTFTGQAQRR